MRFPNAQAGVQKLYTAEILAIIAAICMIIAGVGVAAAAGSVLSGSYSGAAGGGVVGVLFGIAASVLVIIAFIFRLLGLNTARKDDDNFKIAFYAAIAGIVLQVLAAIFTASPVASGIISFLSNICTIAVLIYVIKGVESVAGKLQDNELVAKAKRLFMIVICVYGIGIIIALIGMLVRGGAALITGGILSIVASILQIVALVLYILLLKNAKESFKAA